MRFAITRWGGSVGFLRSDVYASNANNIDFYLIKAICQLGVTISIITKPSINILNVLKLREQHPEWELWMSNLILDYEKFPDLSKYQGLLIQQGSENLRITGENAISSQFYVYRILREFKGSVFYLQYDAYIPIWLSTETKLSDDQKYYTCNTKEAFHDKSINILCPGNKPEQYRKLYRNWGIESEINFCNFKLDTHNLMYQMLDEYKDIYKIEEWSSNRMAFVGKDRNGGSRYEYLMEACRNDGRIKLDLYGDWIKSDFMEQKDNTIFYNGKIPRGVSSVLTTYNSHICSPLIANDRYVESNQFTARVFEVFSSRTLPLIEESWCPKFIEYLGEDTVKLLSFNKYNLGEKYQMVLSNPEWRNQMVNHCLTLFKNTLINDNPFKQVLDLLEYSIIAPRTNGDQSINRILMSNFTRESNSNVTRTRNSAKERFNNLTQYYSSPLIKPNKPVKSIYGFIGCSVNEEKLVEYFDR